MKRSISAFEPGAVMESTAFPFLYSTSVSSFPLFGYSQDSGLSPHHIVTST